MAGLSEEKVADLKEAFAMFDINGDGRLGHFRRVTVLRECLPVVLTRGLVEFVVALYVITLRRKQQAFQSDIPAQRNTLFW